MALLQHITDLNNEAIRPYYALSENQLKHYREPFDGLFVAESRYVIERALAAGYQPLSFLCDISEFTAADQQLIDPYDVPLYLAPSELLRQIKGISFSHGMLALFQRQPERDYRTLLADHDRLVILEHVQNPTNLGAIFRSAAALNMDAILMSENCVDPLYRRASRVAMGTVFQIPYAILHEDWPLKAMALLHAHGYKTVSLALAHHNVPLDDPQLNSEDKLAIIMGSEGYGLEEQTILQSDYVVKIDMAHGVDSLNVAACSAVAFYQLAKKGRD